MAACAEPGRLKRELGLAGAIVMGLGSIVGSGVFVGIGIAAGIAGPSVVLAIVVAALLATCNALSSAQLAAINPVSGGAYEYGYRYLSPSLGFIAGWTFLCAKTASAATAALGFAGYFLYLGGGDPTWRARIAVIASFVLALLVLTGLRRSNWVNMAMVALTLGALVVFVITGAPAFFQNGARHFTPFFPAERESQPAAFFHAAALMFVAFAGYARIATMSEEVKHPSTTIPRAIIATLVISGALYIGVTLVAIGAVGADALSTQVANAATPLEAAASTFGAPAVGALVAIGAMTAMLGVLLNLILGLSRMALAMARRGDLPALFARLTRRGATPAAAVALVGAAIAIFAAFGGIETAWSFSAFSILIYYAITNLAALQLSKENRIYPRFIALLGLLACVALAFFVPESVWMAGVALLAVGLVWHVAARAFWRASGQT
jgi:APA family basic amino acid/polyamine antiporter